MARGSTDVSVGFVFIDTYILSDKFAWQNITKLHWDTLRATVAVAARIYDWVIVVGDRSIIPGGDAYLSKTLRPFLKEMQVDAYISGGEQNMEIVEVNLVWRHRNRSGVFALCCGVFAFKKHKLLEICSFP